MSFSGDLFWGGTIDFGRSIFLGKPGTFMTSDDFDTSICIVFTENSEEKDPMKDPNSVSQHHSRGLLGQLVSPVRQIVRRVIESPMFHCMNQTYVHTFVHEASHGFAERWFSGQNPETIVVYLSDFGGFERAGKRGSIASWKESVICAAGPMGNMALCTCKLVAAQALQNSVCWPVSVVLGGSAVINMLQEISCVGYSALVGDKGDFGQIREHGTTHLAAAGTAFIAQGAFALLAAVQLVS